MKVPCSQCNGTGRAELPGRLRKCHAAIEKLQPAKVSRIAADLKAEITAVHHLIKRLVNDGLVERVPESSPAQYRVRQ